MTACNQPGLMPLDKGMELLLSAITGNTDTEQVSLDEALGRVLASDVSAPNPVPGFDNSAMDGYAIRRADIALQATYPVQGKAFAGKPLREPLKPNHAVRITTGAAVPKGADTIIMQENTDANEQQVRFKQLADVGNNIRRAGEDIRAGQVVVRQNTRLNAAHLAILASVGLAVVPVYRKTRVALLSTGDELKTPGEVLQYGDIYNSNGPSVCALLNKLGVEVINYGVIADDPERFRSAFLKADHDCDFVVTSGGVSVGEADYSKDILQELGTIGFWKLAIKPGKPFAFGHLPNSYFIGLPGNPVSALVTFHILASQAIRQHQNIGEKPMQTLTAISTDDIKKSPGRMDFQRGRWCSSDGGIRVELTRSQQASHILTSLAEANCYIALEAERGDVKAGEQVTLWLFDDLLG